jgi:hypothetical protein
MFQRILSTLFTKLAPVFLQILTNNSVTLWKSTLCGPQTKGSLALRKEEVMHHCSGSLNHCKLLRKYLEIIMWP